MKKPKLKKSQAKIVHKIEVMSILLVACSLLGAYADVMTNANTPAADAATPSYYYGADLSKMKLATGVDSANPNTISSGKPWPQNAGNYCFLATTQAAINFTDALRGVSTQYPTKNGQGPSSGSPSNAVAGQILYDMDHYMIPAGGPLAPQGSGANRRPFTLANIAYDFGGDPRAIAAGVNYELSAKGLASDAQYHQHIYHNGTAAATFGIAKAVATYNKPVIVLVNHAEHAVIVAGVWANANPATNPNAQITALAVYNPWNQSWGTYLSKGYYAKVSYSSWTAGSGLPSPFGGTNTWYKLPYQSNGSLDPDPSIGIYQAGAGTANPTAHHWINNFVTVQFDGHATSADTAYNENDAVMTTP